MTLFIIIISLTFVGFAAGFLCSMPIGGPVSILVASNGLKGRLNFCRNTAIGGAVVVFFYVYIAVYGLARYYHFYAPYIAYVVLAGSVFLFILGARIAFTKIDLENDPLEKKKSEQIGGFRTGFMVNLLNPTLFLGWLMTSFFFISLATSFGLDMGGLDELLNKNINNLEQVSANVNLSETVANTHPNSIKHLWLMSLTYSLGLAIGSVAWYFIFSKWLVNNRQRINSRMVNIIFPVLGIILVVFGVILVFKALAMLSIL